MSENEIKPVAWKVGNSENGPFSYRKTGTNGWRYASPVYDHSAFDCLLEKIERLEMIESSWLEFMKKTEWVQTASHVSELGKHRADVLKDRIDRLTAELDAAVADAKRYRWLKAGGKHAVGYLELMSSSDGWDSAIDAARVETE